MARRLLNGRGEDGFTLLELLLVLFIVALLAAVAVPNVQTILIKSREAALMENLSVMRRALDEYHADKGQFPEELEQLVTEKYIRFIPNDPVSSNVMWNIIFDDDGLGISDIRSYSRDHGLNEIPYNQW